jgi:regulatory protein
VRRVKAKEAAGSRRVGSDRSAGDDPSTPERSTPEKSTQERSTQERSTQERSSKDDKTTEIAAVRLLARREHSTRDLKRKLEGKGHDREAVDRVVNKLSDKKLLSDERFAATFVVHHGRRGQGPVRIRAELRQQGASDEVIDAALARSELNWAELAAQTRVRKFGAARPGSLPERAKQARFLQYRGFSADHIRAALSGSAAPATDDELGLAGPDGFD